MTSSDLDALAAAARLRLNDAVGLVAASLAGYRP